MSADEAIRARLKRLVREHSQSTLARATGVPQPSISRYLSGRRIPAGFCTALVRSLAVNPAWLLTGEGMPYLTDVPAETAGTARDLLELVRAMRAVAQVKLGALIGREHARALRSLHTQLAGYEEVRERLSERTRPLFRRVLEDLEAALRDDRHDQAAWLADAADQAGRLCDDESLHLRREELAAWRLYQEGRLPEALARQRRLVFRHLAADERGEQEVDRMRNYVVGLDATGRLDEARRMACALRELYRTDPPGTAHHEFAFLAGTLDIETGALRRGLAAMQAALPHIGAWGRHHRAMIDKALLLAGVRSVDDLLGAARAGWKTLHPVERGHVASVLGVGAVWREEVPLVTRVLDVTRDTLDASAEPSSRWLRAHMEALVAARGRDGARAFRRLAKSAAARGMLAAPGAEHRLLAHQALCHVAWTAGARAEARRQLEAAEEVRREAGVGRIFGLALHYRNARRVLGPRVRAAPARDLREHARRFFEQHVANGYVLFAECAAGS